jgi:hypothetical protein
VATATAAEAAAGRREPSSPRHLSAASLQETSPAQWAGTFARGKGEAVAAVRARPVATPTTFASTNEIRKRRGMRQYTDIAIPNWISPAIGSVNPISR